jgi:hypothetical protein
MSGDAEDAALPAHREGGIEAPRLTPCRRQRDQHGVSPPSTHDDTPTADAARPNPFAVPAREALQRRILCSTGWVEIAEAYLRARELAHGDGTESRERDRNMGPVVIGGVPVDLRSINDAPFKQFEAGAAMSAGGDTRVLFLATSGVRGSGKSVQLVIDCARFVTSTAIAAAHGGCEATAMYITFNGAAAALGDEGPLRTKVAFARAVCARIGLCVKDHQVLHQVEQAMVDATRLAITAAVANAPADDRAHLPIIAALKAAKRALNLHDDAPVLLAVDELVLAARDAAAGEEVRTARAFLSTLAAALDAVRSECVTKHNKKRGWLYLSVAAYGCIVLQEFTTISSRPLLLQALPPILPFATTKTDVQSVPAFLRPFVVAEQRTKLPLGKDSQDREHNLRVYSGLSRLLIATGGHPRVVRNLCATLAETAWPQVTTFENGERFRDTLGGVVASIDPRSLSTPIIDWTTRLPTAMAHFANAGFDTAKLMNELAVDCSQPFVFPHEPADAVRHRALLQCTETGAASFIEPVPDRCFAFVALPVIAPNVLAATPGRFVAASDLDDLRRAVQKSPAAASAQALFALGDALEEYSRVDLKDNRGKPFEGVCSRAVHLHCLANKYAVFTELCKSVGGGADDRSALGLKVDCRNCAFIETPLFPCAFNDERTLLTPDKLPFALDKPSIVVPRHKHNLCADFLGVFPCADRPDETVMIFFQCRDWFWNVVVAGAQRKHVFDHFRFDQHFVTDNHVSSSFEKWKARSSPSVSNPFPPAFDRWKEETRRTVHIGYVLMTANPLPMERDAHTDVTRVAASNTDFARDVEYRTLRADEGVTDLEHMKAWLPTAGYNAAAAHRLKQLFAVDPPQ